VKPGEHRRRVPETRAVRLATSSSATHAAPTTAASAPPRTAAESASKDVHGTTTAAGPSAPWRRGRSAGATQAATRQDPSARRGRSAACGSAGPSNGPWAEPRVGSIGGAAGRLSPAPSGDAGFAAPAAPAVPAGRARRPAGCSVGEDGKAGRARRISVITSGVEVARLGDRRWRQARVRPPRRRPRRRPVDVRETGRAAGLTRGADACGWGASCERRSVEGNRGGRSPADAPAAGGDGGAGRAGAPPPSGPPACRAPRAWRDRRAGGARATALSRLARRGSLGRSHYSRARPCLSVRTRTAGTASRGR
jgi:hypothetical protein